MLSTFWFLPISIFGAIIALAPIKTFFSILVFDPIIHPALMLQFSAIEDLKSKIDPLAKKQLSPIVTPCWIIQPLEITTPEPILILFSKNAFFEIALIGTNP